MIPKRPRAPCPTFTCPGPKRGARRSASIPRAKTSGPLSNEMRDLPETLDGPALADDVHDLHAAMKKLYAGYPELNESQTFDVDQTFASWERNARAHPRVALSDAIVEPYIELRRHIRDNHLNMWGLWKYLENRSELAFSEYQATGKVDLARCTFAGITPVEGTSRVVPVMTKTGLDSVMTFSAQSAVASVELPCDEHTITFERRHTPHIQNSRKFAPYEWRTVGDATVIVVRRLNR